MIAEVQVKQFLLLFPVVLARRSNDVAYQNLGTKVKHKCGWV